MLSILGSRSASTHTGLRSRTTLRHVSRSTSSRPRMYRYAIDVHGQLFLHDTKPKNLTSCMKNVNFLNFFFIRLRLNEGQVVVDKGLEEDWTETLDCTLDEALSFGRGQGYHWLSPCQGEYNLIRASDSPIVFRELSDDGVLQWAGDLSTSFQPDKLRVDAETGYVYHPSPDPPSASARRRAEQDPKKQHPYGAYSLLSSALVLQRLAGGLELDPEQFQHGKGGSVQWRGDRFEMAILGRDDVERSRRFRVDDLAT